MKDKQPMYMRKNYTQKYLINFLLCFIAIFSLSTSLDAASSNTEATVVNTPSADKPFVPPFSSIPAPPTSASKSYVLIDFNSGSILGEANANKIIEPASLTKVMTMYVIDQEIAAGRLQLTDLVTISKNAWQTQGSRMFVEVGRQVPVADLINGIIIQSGNDASVAMAEHIAGTEEAFATLMNKAAKDLKMTNTHFANATGMPHNDHYTTAYDLALLSRAIIRDFPDSYEIYSKKEFVFNNIKQINRNRLLWSTSIKADGIKTGYTESAGYCLVASAEQDTMRLIAVVIGADNDKARAKEAASLLQYGFRFYDTVKIYAKNESIGKKRIWLSKDSKGDVGLTQNLYITIPKGKYRNLTAKVETQKYVKAPMTQYAEIGKITVTLDKEVLAEKPLVILNEMAQGGLWQRFKDKIRLAMRIFGEQEQEVQLNQSNNTQVANNE